MKHESRPRELSDSAYIFLTNKIKKNSFREDLA